MSATYLSVSNPFPIIPCSPTLWLHVASPHRSSFRLSARSGRRSVNEVNLSQTPALIFQYSGEIIDRAFITLDHIAFFLGGVGSHGWVLIPLLHLSSPPPSRPPLMNPPGDYRFSHSRIRRQAHSRN